MAKGLTADEINKLPLTPEDRDRLMVHYGVGYTPKKTVDAANALAAMGKPGVETLGGDTAPATAAQKAADAAKAKAMGYDAVEDLGGDDRPDNAETKAADAAKAAGYKIIQPTPTYAIAAPASGSIGKIAPSSMGAPVAVSGPALDVDSAGIGAQKVPKYATEWSGSPDYGSASTPYEVGELGGLGLTEPDKIVVSKPKGVYEFAPDTVTAKKPGSYYEVPAKYAKKGK